WAVYLLDDETKPKFLAKLDLGEAEDDLENVAEKLQEKAGGEGEATESAVREAEEMSKMLAESNKRSSIPPPPQGEQTAPPLPERPAPELPARPTSGIQERPPSAQSQHKFSPRAIN